MSDEDLLPPPLLPIKPPPQPGLAKEGRGDKERERRVEFEFIGDDLRREHGDVTAPSPASEICDINRTADLPPGYLQALLAKVRALGLMSSCHGVNAEALERSPSLPTKTEGPRGTRDGHGLEAGALRRAPASGGGAAGTAAPFPVAASTLLFNAPTAFDIFALQHNPIVLAIRAYQFDLLQKQVQCGSLNGSMDNSSIFVWSRRE